MNAERTARIEKIMNELKKMKTGMCGEKFGVLVWKISENVFSVGLDSVSIHDSWELDSAASLVDDLPKCSTARKSA